MGTGATPPLDLSTQYTINELRRENAMLRNQLANLLEHAHQNQQIMSRHQDFDLKLISTSSFRELVENIFSTLAKMSELDIVTLGLLDRQKSLQKIIGELNISPEEFPSLFFVQNEFDLRIRGEPLRKPVLGIFNQTDHGKMFATCAKKPGSVAIVPLIRQNKLLGYLNLGSFQASRFNATMATDFIEHMASIIAICLENVINNERLTHMGLTDPLTNVSNRRYVEQRMLEEVGRARRQQYSVVCMYLDIDFFKQINDRYGHQGGDDVLIEVSNRIKAELRLSDTMGRFGGEEFVALLINASAEDGMLVAERIRKSVAGKAFQLNSSGSCQVTISIGVSTLSESLNYGKIDNVARELLQDADQALFRAKNQGRNRVCEST
ncbi:sensor domain-containing diguanylate cyclase [Undibacterium sp. Jales W-56]|uniref:sensor domain-containing diguanylate cyclase n=1 Tax=Undibacterium sp. Jales W-56 TaxID=2897325 RepID=UPI0021CE883D|nr:sensor domain-containing diguanylate cyclase [Undibacterium sp. Jales W-56]MCU6435052.1 sensor domain-containing diguanylate cyclase [Undibacterium sp. Jales W-56]